MSNDKFRTENVTVGNQVIKLEMKPIEEIFRFKLPPFIILAGTGGGKTTLAMDIIHKFSEECTYIYYITATEDGIRSDATNSIPNVFKRKPIFEEVSAVWSDIEAMSKAVNADLTSLKSLLTSICGLDEAGVIINKLDTEIQKLSRNREAEYSQSMSRQEAAKLAVEDAKAFAYDTLSKLIVDKSRTVGTNTLNAEEVILLQSLISKPPKILLLLDDVSSQLQGMNSDRRKVTYGGMPMLVKEAFNQLITDILTRGRHYNMITCLFVHTLDVIRSKDLLANIIVLDRQQAGTIQRAGTFAKNIRDMIPALIETVFRHRYHFLYLSLDNSRPPMVGLADLHAPNEQIKLNPMLKRFVNVCDSIQAKQLPTTQQNIWNEDINETFEDNIDDNNGDDMSGFI